MTLQLDPAPPPAEAIRRELVDLFLRDILGPAGGPEEEVAEGRIEERYLVGLLAPQKRRFAPEELDGIANGGTDSGEDRAFIAEVPELPASAADATTYREELQNVDTTIQEWIDTEKAARRPTPQWTGRPMFARRVGSPDCRGHKRVLEFATS